MGTLHAPVVRPSTVLLDNALATMGAGLPSAMGLPEYGLDYGNPDFVRYAEAYGAGGHRVASTDEIRSLLASCRAAGGVHVVDVPVDYSQNDHVLNREIKELSRAL